MFSPDARIAPQSALPDLEAILLDVPLDQVQTRIRVFVRDYRVEMAPFVPADFIEVVATGRFSQRHKTEQEATNNNDLCKAKRLCEDFMSRAWGKSGRYWQDGECRSW